MQSQIMIFKPFLCQSLNSSEADSGAQRDNLVTFVQGFPFLGPLVESHTVRTEPSPHHDAQWGPKGRWDSSEERKTLPNKAVRHCSRMVGWVGGGGLDTMRELCGIWVSWWTVPVQPSQAAGG